MEAITGVRSAGDPGLRPHVCQRETAAILGHGRTQFLPWRGNRTFADQLLGDPHRQLPAKPSVGVNPVRGQNNVPGPAIWARCRIPIRYQQYVKFPENREKFARKPGRRKSPLAHTGYRISELPHRAAHGEVRAAYIMGKIRLQTDAEAVRYVKGLKIWNW